MRKGDAAIALYLLMAALGHAATIAKRPSGTTVVDAMLFGTFLVPVAFALTPARFLLPLGYAYGGLVLAGLFFAQPVLWKTWPSQNDQKIISRIDEVHAAVKLIGRPIALLLPDNRIHPYSPEAFGLYTGQLNITGNSYGSDLLPKPFPASALRQKLFPDTFMFNRDEARNLHAAIEAGYVVVWGEATNAPSIGTFFPEVEELPRRTYVNHSVYEILPGGAVRTHVAYLKHPSRPVVAH